MSTKTNFKRIALVAVSTLGLSLLGSIAPAQAVITAPTVTATAGTATTSLSDSTTASVVTVTALMDQTASPDTVSVSITNAVGNAYKAYMVLKDTSSTTATTVDTLLASITQSGAVAAKNARTLALLNTATESATSINGAAGNGPQLTMHLDTTVGNVGYVSARFNVFLETRVAGFAAGTYNYTISVKSYDAGVLNAAKTVTANAAITVALAAAESKTVASLSTAVLYGGSSFVVGNTSDSVVSALATASTTSAAVVRVTLRNASNAAVAQESITATITGAGTIGDGTTFGKSVTLVSSAGINDLQIRPDGQTGTGTIAISTPSFTFQPKSISFYAAAAKTITATVGYPLLELGANTDPVRATALDANGTPWTGQMYIVASSAADALVAGSTTPVACSYDSGSDQRHECSITTLTTGTAKFKLIDASTVALATATSNEVTVTVSGATAATVKIEFDKATYAPNERARIYVTPLDSAGKPIQKVALANLFATGGITTNSAVSYTGALPTTADSLSATSITTSASSSSSTGARAGSAVYTVYMPSSGGTVTLTATGGVSLPPAARVVVTATATVTDNGAAALAAVNALATTVASLKTLITTLTNLVLKIQKKVKA